MSSSRPKQDLGAGGGNSPGGMLQKHEIENSATLAVTDLAVCGVVSILSLMNRKLANRFLLTGGPLLSCQRVPVYIRNQHMGVDYQFSLNNGRQC